MMQKIIEKLEAVLEWGGTTKDILCLVLGGLSLIVSLFDLVPLPFDAAWIAIILCGLPIILEAIIGLVTAFDIKADGRPAGRTDRVQSQSGYRETGSSDAPDRTGRGWRRGENYSGGTGSSR